ncbi:MAG: decarboxylating 6-phosphogluconate dehydrogenase [Nitrospirota bacterium]
MKIGYIGLGKMGYNMATLLLDKGYQVIAYDRSDIQVKKIAERGAESADSIKTLVSSLSVPRFVWMMVPHPAVEDVLKQLIPLLAKGDTVVDGGNSPYKDSLRRSKELEAKGIDFLDAGVSGGPSGARSGACIMVGGKKETVEKHYKLFQDLSAPQAFAYVGISGAGHFVKMVHNGIEYGMMQALAEGFSLLHESPFHFDLVQIADMYNHRSVIESRLVGWLKNALEQNGTDLEAITGSAGQSGEGMWTVQTAKELGIPMPVIKAALDFRLESQHAPSYTGKIISALRYQFGGHEAKAMSPKVLPKIKKHS